MDLTTLKELLMNYVPYIAAIIGFLASGLGVIRSLKEILKKSNVEEIKAQIHDENSTLSAKINELIDMYKAVMTENATLKKQNDVLIGELKRIANYEYKEE